MRIVVALLAMLSLAAAPAPRDWTQVATKTAAGAYVVGNPRARVRLVEYGSYTCSHCAQFAVESGPVLKDRMIRGGAVSLEFRHVVFDALGLAAAVLARCTGPRNFLATSAYLFETQDSWLDRGIAFQRTNSAIIALYPRTAQFRAIADGAGLTQMLVARGLSPAAIDACFADEAELDRIATMAGDVASTPTFDLNGKRLPPVTWTRLEPQLRAAGAR